MDPVFPALATLSQGEPERLARGTLKALKMLAAAGLPLTAAIVVLAGPIVNYTIPGFGAAVPVLRVLGAGAVLLFANNVFIYTLNAMGRQRDATRLAAVSLAFNVILNLILIPLPNRAIGGYMGAAIATVLTEVGALCRRLVHAAAQASAPRHLCHAQPGCAGGDWLRSGDVGRDRDRPGRTRQFRHRPGHRRRRLRRGAGRTAGVLVRRAGPRQAGRPGARRALRVTRP